MTDAAWPRAGTRPRAATSVAPANATAAVATRRTFAIPVPAHVGVVLGLATAGYGIALAGVTALQASADASVAADRAPIAAAIDATAAAHDRLGAALDDAGRAYEQAANGYADAAERLAQVDQIGDLATITHAVDGATRALPTRIAMPPVVRTVASSPTRSTAHATSGGSAAP